ncbi:MAG: hypothetical protein ACK4QP_18060 [Pseudorhizobium sp.]
MPTMRNVHRPLLLLAVLVSADAAILKILLATMPNNFALDRLLSLAGGMAAAWWWERFVPLAPSRPYPPGFWPLVAVTLCISYGIFTAFAAQAPHVQPMAYLALSWLGAITFGCLGWWRICRRR